MAKAHLRMLVALSILISACLPAYTQNQEPQPATSLSPSSTASPADPEDSTQLVLIKSPKPSYPIEAERQGVQGTVWIHLLISETGDVEKTDVISGDPDLARAAQEAMKKWKFKPYIRNGKPAKVSTKMSFDFAFKDNITESSVPPDSPANASPSPAEAAGTPDGESSGSPAQRLRISSGLAHRLLLHDVAPTYPLEARRRQIQGTVVLQATIGKDGLIQNLKVLSGDPILVKAAQGAVEQWRYRPYVLNGNPVEVETTIKIQFHM